MKSPFKPFHVTTSGKSHHDRICMKYMYAYARTHPQGNKRHHDKIKGSEKIPTPTMHVLLAYLVQKNGIL